MRILVHDRSGHPFQVQLSRELARRGYKVLHSYGAFFQTPKGSLRKMDDDPKEFDVVGIELDEPFQKYSYLKRHKQELKYSQLLIKQIHEFSPEVVILANMPPNAQTAVYSSFKNSNIQFIFWLQDLYGIAITKILKKKLSFLGSLVGQYYTLQERALLKQSDNIVLITEDFWPTLAQWGIAKEKVHIIPNWAPINEIPVRPKINRWSESQGLHDSFCILYSGTLGMKHNPDLLLQLALYFKDNPIIKVVVISEGLGAEWLRERKLIHNLDNLLLLDFQPFSQYADVLGSADILVAILEPDAGVFSVPSKVLSYMCAERPLLLAIPPENLAARTVSQNEAGLVVHPSDINSFIEFAKRLVEDEMLRNNFAINAHTYAQTYFDIEAIANKFEVVIGKPHN